VAFSVGNKNCKKRIFGFSIDEKCPWFLKMMRISLLIEDAHLTDSLHARTKPNKTNGN
jgi:hypothetical protein